MTVFTSAQSLLGVQVRAASGESLGRVDHVYTEELTGEPEWVAVHTGLFGTHICLVPISAFSWTPVGETLTVSLSREAVSRAPHHDPGALVTAADAQALDDFYGIAVDPDAVAVAQPNFDHRRLHRTGTERADILR